MNDFKRLNELVREQKAQMNALYKDLDNEIVNAALALCGLKGQKSERVALLRRIVDLKVDPLQNELKKLNFSDDEQKRILKRIFGFVKDLYESATQSSSNA